MPGAPPLSASLADRVGDDVVNERAPTLSPKRARRVGHPVYGVLILVKGWATRRIDSAADERWVPHTFAVFECVGDRESSDPRLADAERCGNRLYVNRRPLITKAVMGGH